MLPVLERLLYKPRDAPVTRVLTLVPTRELGVQVYNVTRQIAQFTSIECCLAVGRLTWSKTNQSIYQGGMLPCSG